MEELVDDILVDLLNENDGSHVFANQFIQRLEDMGYMIVPIEDPTNLFGIQEDSL